MALPLALVGLAGVVALVVLHGEQPGRGAVPEAVPGTSRPTLVSAHRSSSVVVPTSGTTGASPVEEVARVERDVREAVRSGPSPATEVPVEVAAPETEVEPTAEERRQRGERSHRHRPTWSVTLLPPTTSAAETPVPVPDGTATGSAGTVAPDPAPPTLEPVPPASEVVPAG